MQHARRLVLAVLFLFPLFTPAPFNQYAAADQFPATAGDEIESSLACFRIITNAAFNDLLEGPIVSDDYPRYNRNNGRINSPIMHDPAGVIGRSGPHTNGDANDFAGVPVGLAGSIVADGNFMPEPAGFQGPTGTREAHAELYDLEFTDVNGIGMKMRAGIAAPDRVASYGELESKTSAGVPALDTPAETFFDFYFEIDLPADASSGFPGATIYNQDPLLLTHDGTEFPLHIDLDWESEYAVRLYFKDAEPGLWEADDIFGWIAIICQAFGFEIGEIDDYDNIIRPPKKEKPVNEHDRPMAPTKETSWTDVKTIFR